MKLLITSAWKVNQSDLKKLKENGFIIFFSEDNIKLYGVDPASIDCIVCNSFFCFNDIALFKSLKTIQLTSSGIDRVPIDYINENGIKLFNARGVYSIPISEYVVGNLLSFYKKNTIFAKQQENREWNKIRNLDELYQKKIAILGCGSIGTEIAKRLFGFGCDVVGFDKIVREDDWFAKILSIKKLKQEIAGFDVLILCLPLTDETRHFINSELLSLLKQNSILINVSRGQIINEDDLINCLLSKKIYAILDVFENEPLNKDSILWELDNVLLTPHISFASVKNDIRLSEVIVSNLLG